MFLSFSCTFEKNSTSPLNSLRVLSSHISTEQVRAAPPVASWEGYTGTNDFMATVAVVRTACAAKEFSQEDWEDEAEMVPHQLPTAPTSWVLSQKQIVLLNTHTHR